MLICVGLWFDSWHHQEQQSKYYINFQVDEDEINVTPFFLFLNSLLSMEMRGIWGELGVGDGLEKERGVIL